MATELRTDVWHRYMLYRASDYRDGLRTREEKQESINAGKKFALSAYPDVWAKDAALVGRVRRFFRENFHWYERRANTDSNLAIVELLFESIRSGAVVVAQEEPPRSGGGSALRPAQTSALFGASMEGYGLSYLEQLRRDDAAEEFTNRMFAQIKAAEEQAAARLSATDNDALTTSTPLSDAQPFELGNSAVSSDVTQVAGMPFHGVPGSWIESGPGSMLQWRQYGANGTPLTDFDFEAHHGNPNPHAHNWDGTSRDQGWPVSPL